jgi:SAM-dependent methyltransferase
MAPVAPTTAILPITRTYSPGSVLRVQDQISAWAAALDGLKIPPEIQAQAAEDPWQLSVEPFARAAAEAADRDTVATRRAREALADGGSVLDIGCGAGAGSAGLVPPATKVIGVDDDPRMLDAYRLLASERGIPLDTIEGTWPAIASDVAVADVVVCNHVLYNIPDIEPFVRELVAHTRSIVVCELTAEHPRDWMNPHWLRFHDLMRTPGPTALQAADIIHGLGFAVEVSVTRRDLPPRDLDEVAKMVRRQLCLPPEREVAVRASLEELPPPSVRELVTLVFAGS